MAELEHKQQEHYNSDSSRGGKRKVLCFALLLVGLAIIVAAILAGAVCANGKCGSSNSISSNNNNDTATNLTNLTTVPKLSTTTPTTVPTLSITTATPTTLSPTVGQQRPQDNAVMRILPLGDSITMNGFGHFSYRYYLWRTLVLQLHDAVDFVGTLRDSAYGNNPDWPPVVLADPNTGRDMEYDFDQDHEGHWGEGVEYILDHLDGWLDSYSAPPTIALVHLGTNDCIAGEDPNGIYQELLRVAETLHAHHPDMQVFVATLIPSTYSTGLQDCLDAVNNNLEASLLLNTVGGPVHLVDMVEGFDIATDTWDSLHPTSEASETMANKWYDAIVAEVGSGK